MIEGLNPALILLVGGVLLPLLPPLWRALLTLLLPTLGLVQLVTLPAGDYAHLSLFGLSLTTLRLDPLSFVFALIFHLAALLAGLYALHLRDRVQQAAALVYAGAAIGAVLAGDLLTLFIYWELTAVASVLLIWARGTERAYRAGLRYLIIQVASGVLLLAGAALYVHGTGTLAFAHIGLYAPGGWLIFLAFGIKCAFPLLHNWLQDAYPEATVTGAVVLSAFTTKMAVYALARGFAGVELLVYIGALMTLLPMLYAVIENDLRRVLAYSLNIQLGFMVVAIGIGTELALNGAAAHAFTHVLYKSLLFMSMGAVLLRVGTVQATELGGLYRSMPYTAAFCIVGMAAISAVPLFSGFVSKSLILSAVAEEHHTLVWLALLAASAGALLYVGIKVPYFAFFGTERGLRCEEAPDNMRWAMGITALLCVLPGLYPPLLYQLLPYPVDYALYTADHVIAQTQLLLFAALAFVVLLALRLYPLPRAGVNLDFDWSYRVLLPILARWLWRGVGGLQQAYSAVGYRLRGGMLVALFRRHITEGQLAHTWPTGSMVLWMAVLLGGCLIFYYF